MGRLRLHTYYCLSLLLCAVGLSGVKAEVERPLLNETESNEVQLSNDVTNDVLEHKDITTEHPHAMKGKPSKFDLDVTEMVYMDSKKMHNVETQVDSSVKRRSKCQNAITIDCLETKLSSFIDKMSTSKTLNVTDSIQIVKTETTTPTYPDESLLDKVHRFAKNHVMRIQLNQDMINPGESRTFFGGKYLSMGFLLTRNLNALQ